MDTQARKAVKFSSETEPEALKGRLNAGQPSVFIKGKESWCNESHAMQAAGRDL